MTREDVIKGLQKSAAYFRSSFDALYGTVACEKFRSWTDAIEQAIALLKAQEPRVMTLAEAVSGDECWLECVNGVNGWCDCVLDYDNPKCVNVYRPRIDSIAWVDEYGKTWRCWTSRPTDAQREAEPWRS